MIERVLPTEMSFVFFLSIHKMRKTVYAVFLLLVHMVHKLKNEKGEEMISAFQRRYLAIVMSRVRELAYCSNRQSSRRNEL